MEWLNLLIPLVPSIVVALIALGIGKQKISALEKRVDKLERKDEERNSGREQIVRELVAVKTTLEHMAEDIKELKDRVK